MTAQMLIINSSLQGTRVKGQVGRGKRSKGTDQRGAKPSRGRSCQIARTNTVHDRRHCVHANCNQRRYQNNTVWQRKHGILTI